MRRLFCLLSLLLTTAQARELTPVERRQVAEQVRSWEAPTSQLGLQAAAELGDVDGTLAGLRQLPEPNEVRAAAGVALLPGLARQGNIKAAQEVLRLIGEGRLQAWFWGAYLFTKEQGLESGLKLLEALPAAKDRVSSEAMLGQMVLAEAKLRPIATRLGEQIWKDYQSLPVSDRQRLQELVLPTIALTGQFSRAEGLLTGKANPMGWVYLADAYYKMDKPAEARLALAKLQPYQKQTDIVRIRSAQLLVKLGDADEAYRVSTAAPLFWTMQLQTVRELAGQGFAGQAAKLARGISPFNLRTQALAEVAALLAAQGQRSVALKLAREAQALLTPASEQSSAALVVRALVMSGDVSGAEQLLQTQAKSPQGAEKLRTALVRTLAEQGDIAGALKRLGQPLTLAEMYALIGAAETRLNKGDELQARQLLYAAQEKVAQLPGSQQAEARIQLQRNMASLLPDLLSEQPGAILPEVRLMALGTYGKRGQVSQAQWIVDRFSDAEQRLALLSLAIGLKQGGHADLLLEWLNQPQRREVAAKVLLSD